MLAAMLLAGCSKDDGNSAQQAGGEAQEICVQTNLTKMQTRATTYDDAAGLQAEAHFTCTAYNAGTLTEYIPTTTVDWNSTQWQFNNGASHYYWPLPASNGGAWPSLDFFGYMPSAANLSTEAPYIGSINYTAEHNVTFTCSGLPMTNAEQGSSLKEFMFGMALDQNYGNASAGVPLTFQHPFALIKFTITAASGTHVQINSISIAGLYTNATCTYNGTAMTWGSYSGSATMTIAQTLKNGGTTETSQFLVIPKNYGSKYLTVNATWDDWSDVTISDYGTNVDFNWEPGCKYTYNLTLDKTGLIVNTSEFTEQW